jgi:biofilm PGA synthesis N-glycosyltransferase PgaC
MFKITTSIGICANNEERNISKLLDALLSQQTTVVDIIQIIVVSYSTDRTNEIVEKYGKLDDRIKLVRQEKREGKASAVNMFLKEAVGDVLVLESADTIPQKYAIEKLVKPFLNLKIGVTGGRPIPTNNRRKFMGFVSYLLWKMHHEISTEYIDNPKFGEIIAFRNVVKKIPNDTAVDEAWIEIAIRKKGFSLHYVPASIVYNHGPESVTDFLRQRRRIYAGHLILKEKIGAKVSTMEVPKILRIMPRLVGFNSKELLFFFGAVLLEVYGRFLGAYDFYVKKRNPYVWDIAASTKEV